MRSESELPRDLARRLDDLTDATGERPYGELVAETGALPPRAGLPACPTCGEAMAVRAVLTSDGGVAVAVRLFCDNAGDHKRGEGLQFVYELATRSLYLEAREPVEEQVCLTVPQFRRALARAADGEAIGEIVAEYQRRK